jgi:hypothetical protein
MHYGPAINYLRLISWLVDGLVCLPIIVLVVVIVLDLFVISRPGARPRTTTTSTIETECRPYRSRFTAQIQDQDAVNFLHALDILM